MASLSAPQRALAFGCATVIVVIGAQLALAALPWSPSDALAIDAFASAMVLALVAAAIASFSNEPLLVRLSLGPSELDSRGTVLAAVGLIGLSHAAQGVVTIAGLPDTGLIRFDTALSGLGAGELLLPLLGLGLASACGEEIFFRGLLQGGLAERLGGPAAIAITATAFGAAHADWTHGAAAAVLGAYLGLVAARTRSIRPAIAAHAANNVVALLEKAMGVALPTGEILTILLGTTLACVGLTVLARKRLGPVQFPRGSDDTRFGP